MSEASKNNAPLKGPDVIADAVTRLPASPGVYRMIGEDGSVLYVGKARRLKARVSNYTRLANLPARLQRMVMATQAMEFVTTRTETEALLLEANLIKRLRPRYNVLLRDDKSFPYILIAEDHEAPQLLKHRGARGRKGSYFGPFASAGAVNRAINAMERAFLLRTCSDGVYSSRTRPCLLFQIKRCSGPCTGEISPADYAGLVGEAKAFLSGGSKAIRAELAEAMEQAAERLDFEQAARLRDRISALSQIQAHQGINPQGVEEADLFALAEDGGQTCVQVFFFRTGQNWGNRSYFPRADKGVEAAEVLQSFIAQFYDDKPPPRLILTSHDLPEEALLAEALSERAARKVEVRHPQRGEKRDLVEHGLANARDALARKLAESASQARLLEGLAETLELDTPPRRIEIYDNSHIMGTNAIGAMVVSGPEGFVKGQYRTFTIRNEDTVPGDDFAMMREVLTRRFQRLMKENPQRRTETETLPDWPDLVIIDGGKGQLSAVKEVLADLGIASLPLLAVSKGPDRDAGREIFHRPGKDALMLQPRDPVLFFVQRLRDEAHRFAIGTHRAKRAKAQVQNPLDEIAGIGPARKRALLNHFGSAKGAARASLTDLTGVKGISEDMARIIHDHFRGPEGGRH